MRITQYIASVNVTVGEKEERMMMTGTHAVVHIFGVGCDSIVGWKYEAAYEKSQKNTREGNLFLRGLWSWALMETTISYMASPEAQVAGRDADDA